MFHSEVPSATNLAMKDLFFKAQRGHGEDELDSGRVRAAEGTQVDARTRVIYVSFPPSGGYSWYCNVS